MTRARSVNAWPDLSIRRGDWKLWVNADGARPELYDLATDVGERTNLAHRHKDLVATLGGQVIAWYHGPPVRLPPRPTGNATADSMQNGGG